MTLSADDFLALTQSQDVAAALAAVEASGTPVETTAAYDSLLRDLYWKHKRADLVGVVATAGIAYCRRHADAATDSPARAAFASAAKALAYNLASFTWPGWDEAGLSLTPALVAQGLAAAQLNLQLALELEKPADKVRGAHWLLGVHLLVAPHAGHVEEARRHLRQAVPPEGDKDGALFRGYVLLAEILLGRSEAESAWSALITELQARPEEAARFACGQLTTARRALARSSVSWNANL